MKVLVEDASLKNTVPEKISNIREITLPNNNIELSGLIITRQISFIGSPGSVIKLKQGSIAIKDGSLSISETAILSYSPKPVFEVGTNSELKLLDCSLKANPGLASEAVCIYVCPDNNKQGGTVSLTACNFVGFFTHILLNKNSSLDLDNSSLSDSNNSNILAVNPAIFKVTNSTFDNSGQTPIEIRYTSAAVCDSKIKREITIKENTISNSKISAVSICSETSIIPMVELPDIIIDSNVIFTTGQEGIVLKKLGSYKSIKISKNKISSCGTHGISLASMQQMSNLIELTNNSITTCKGNGISISDSNFRINQCSCIQNNEYGIVLRRIRPSQIEDLQSIPYQAIIQNCGISENREDGIAIFESNDSRILLDNNIIEWNAKHGLSISSIMQPTGGSPNNSLSTAAIPIVSDSNYSLSKKKGNIAGKVIIKNGKLQFNKIGGLQINNQRMSIDNLSIQSNGVYAISGDIDKIKFVGDTLEKKAIIGTVLCNGNNRIDIYKKKKSTQCCGVGCSIL